MSRYDQARRSSALPSVNIPWILDVLSIMAPQHLEQYLRSCSFPHAARDALLAYIVDVDPEFPPGLESRVDALLSPISRLPPEILVHIFKLIAEDDAPYYNFPSKYHCGPLKQSLGWIQSLTHVNSQWRNVCLATPDLWSMHIASLPRATPVFVERAGNHVPLTVIVESGNPLARADSQFDSLVAQSLMWRMETLFWSTHDASTIRLFALALRSGPLPVLDVLHLEYEGDRESELFYQDSCDAPIDAPNATDIGFLNCLIPFVAPRLTLLDLEVVALPCVRLLEVLKGCPVLESLTLFACVYEGDFSGCAVVPLSRLRHCRVTGFADERSPQLIYRELIEHLLLPASASFTLDVDDEPGSPNELEYIVPAVRYMWQDNPPDTLQINHWEVHRHSIEFFSGMKRLESVEDYYEHHYDDFSLKHERAEFRISSSRRFAAAMIAGRLPIHTEFAGIAYFSVRSDEFDLHGWVHIFRALFALDTLHLTRGRQSECSNDSDSESDAGSSDDEAIDVFKALASPFPDASTDDRVTVSPSTSAAVLPRLRYLWLATSLMPAEQYEINTLLILEHLTSAMKRRAELHVSALGTLRLDIIDEPSVNTPGSTDAQVLRELAGNILWRSGSSRRD